MLNKDSLSILWFDLDSEQLKVRAVVNVKISSSTLDYGQWVYLSSTAGTGTTTAPTSGLVYRLGVCKEYNNSAQTDADIIWMPQFIADLG